MSDFVYIVKEGNENIDLQYSLRSIAKFYPDNKVWIVGYKPNWVQNVSYLHVEQSGDKWQNSINNIIAACKCPDISNDFILMNDDFFILHDIYPLETVCNMNIGLLDKSIEEYADGKGPWFEAFTQVRTLLNELEIDKPYYNYEAHLPLLINKSKYLNVMNLPKVQQFMQTDKVLHKRTLYKNIVKPDKIPESLEFDIKVNLKTADIKYRENLCGWVSVYDGQVGSTRCPTLNSVMHMNFPTPCKYENTDILVNINPANLNWILKPTIKTTKTKKKGFIYF